MGIHRKKMTPVRRAIDAASVAALVIGIGLVAEVFLHLVRRLVG